MKINYSNLKISIDKSDNKCFIYYLIVLPDGTKERRKEYGKKYNISLKDLKTRKKNAEELLEMVEFDLNRGIDPKFRNEQIDAINKAKLIEAQKAEESKVSIDKAIDILKKEKGWVNPVESKENTATAVLSTLNNTFKPYLKKIKKAEDVRTVTRQDIQSLIEENFNRNPNQKREHKVGAYKKTGWSSLTAKTHKNRISVLFTTLIDKGFLEVNPVTNIRIKKDNEKLIQPNEDEEDIDLFEPWTDEEASKWFNELATTTDVIEKTVWVASYIIYYSFIRKAELMRLKCSMVDFDNERFAIPAKLTKSSRKYDAKDVVYIDIPDKLLAVLKEWFAFRYPNGFDANDYLLPNKKNTKVKTVYGSFTKHFKLIRDRFQLKYKGEYEKKQQYALKHTGVIKLYNTLRQSNKRPDEIQKMIQNHCRHSDWAETENYLRKSCKIEVKTKKEKINF